MHQTRPALVASRFGYFRTHRALQRDGVHATLRAGPLRHLVLVKATIMRVHRHTLGPLLLLLLVTAMAPAASLARPSPDTRGNSQNAQACQHGGWMALQQTGGGSFASQGACVSYAAQGGTLIVLDPVATLAFAYALNGDCVMTLSGTGFPASQTFEAWFAVNTGDAHPSEFAVDADGSFVFPEGIAIAQGDTLLATIRTLDGTFVTESNAISC
ncbi:MAG: hypothetical protein WBA46_16995 [Thermomicrobiales bacterium]